MAVRFFLCGDSLESASRLQRQKGTSVIFRSVTVIVLVGLIALLIFGVVKRAPSTRVDSRLAEGKSAAVPDFRLQVLKGRPTLNVPADLKRATEDGWLSANELRGRPTVLNFWASWCQPCREEAAFLERTARASAKNGVAFVGINVLDVREQASAFMQEFSISFLNVRDTSLATAKRFGARAMPETYFLSADGRIVGHVVGIVRVPQMASGLLAATTGRPMPTAQGGASRAVEEKPPDVDIKVKD